MAWLVGGVGIIVAFAVTIAFAGRTHRERDLGNVSATWIAQHRADAGAGREVDSPSPSGPRTLSVDRFGFGRMAVAMPFDDRAHVLGDTGDLAHRVLRGPLVTFRRCALLSLSPSPLIVATMFPALRLRAPMPPPLGGTHTHPFYKSGSNTTSSRPARNRRPRSRSAFEWCGSCHTSHGVDGIVAIAGHCGADASTFRRRATYSSAGQARTMRVRLTRKLADQLDGVDVSAYAEDDVLDLPRHKAELLIAEGWALPFRRLERRHASRSFDRAEAADARCLEPRPQRRADDRFRDELHEPRRRRVKRDE